MSNNTTSFGSDKYDLSNILSAVRGRALLLNLNLKPLTEEEILSSAIALECYLYLTGIDFFKITSLPLDKTLSAILQRVAGYPLPKILSTSEPFLFEQFLPFIQDIDKWLENFPSLPKVTILENVISDLGHGSLRFETLSRSLKFLIL